MRRVVASLICDFPFHTRGSNLQELPPPGEGDGFFSSAGNFLNAPIEAPVASPPGILGVQQPKEILVSSKAWCREEHAYSVPTISGLSHPARFNALKLGGLWIMCLTVSQAGACRFWSNLTKHTLHLALEYFDSSSFVLDMLQFPDDA